LENIFSKFAEQLKCELLSLNIEDQEAEAESELILVHVTGLTRTQRLLSDQKVVPEHWQVEIDRILAQRRQRVPIQYCLGAASFMGLDLHVEPGVLIPRVDTEALVQVVVEVLGEHLGKEKLHIAEIGVGAGPIAISLLKKLNNAYLWACDVSPRAIAVTQQNASHYGVSERIKLVLGDWRHKLPDNLDVIVANPPYIPRQQKANLAPEIAWHEPDNALFTDDQDGLSFYRDFAQFLPSHFKANSSFGAFEIGDNQSERIYDLFAVANWRQIKIHLDLNGMPRVLTALVPTLT
jgi:release factor glutamine methyltransferase